MKRPVGLRALRTFHTIVKLGSVTAAAREMGLAQPTASRLLSQLETDMGFELFHRDRGRLIPSPDGLLLFEEVDRALDSVDRVYDLVRDISEYRVGQLKLVAPPSFTEGVLPDIAAVFVRRFPNVHLTIDSHSLEAAKALIATRAVDAGFLRLPLDRPDLRAERVMVSETACILRQDHPLAAQPVIDARALKGVPLILLGLGRSSRAQVDAAFAEAGVRPEVRVETHTVGSACGLASRGVGVAIVNEVLAQSYVRDGAVLRRFSPSIVHEYAFVTSSMTKPTRLAAEFLALTLEHFSGARACSASASLTPLR
ncbi:LysR substrate-binding domain-containing protein [Phenylobacterium sp.]|uniref:LysR substrate-binding domain-containing protein n=1 Tax=Phenylobacterium sp. TaxID=1871053 RepID=UPI002E36AF52|nr:LysR substrate-binding domain-containing protein [Phenylobacterium sp.]HEX4712214.1 LysR substrate-binding domain-containing protein [Phenylobacterium sp.]